MSSVNDWNPDDGPPPSPEEIAEARALEAHLAQGLDARPKDPEVTELVNVALRVRATTRPVDALSAAASRRALRAALDADRPVARVFRLRWGVAAAVAAAGVLAVAVGLQGRSHDRAPDGYAEALPPAFVEAVQPGAGAAPSTRLFDRRLRRYRESYLRGGAR
ncbi:MAG: hypothetical protein R3A48_09465 [Polyangiales bacterium]